MSLIILSGIIIYSLISFGFSDRYISQVNNSIWLDILLKYELDANNFTINQSVENKYLFTDNSIPSEDLIYLNSFADSILTDSLLKTDTTLITDTNLVSIDTTFVDSTSFDSTARLKYFRYQREDIPYIKLKEKKPSRFFVQPSPTNKTRTIEIDSTGQFVIVKETIAGEETKILLRITIDEYIQMRLAVRERQLWEDQGYKYELKDTKKELSELITDITDFEIPLPSVGVLSIFGEPKISLKIGGAVDIHGAFRSETTEGVTASRLGNTRNEPDFKQQVQINVSGTIGDKLNIVADWNTERTFEYENQLKIKYTGYEDEIIQSIEAGNVSLQTSPLVGGSEALFGIKAQFKVGPLSLTTLASQKKGEVKEVSVSGGTSSQEFTVRAYDYSLNHYFLDTLYASVNEDLNLFNLFYGSATPIVQSQYQVVDIQVWKSIKIITSDRSKERNANAFINLQPLNAGQDYDDIDPNLRNELDNPIPGQQETGRFLLLEQGRDYILHPETGYLTFLTQLNPEDVIAVAYRREEAPGTDNDSFFGEFLTSANTDTSTRLVLKLVKPSNLQPNYEQAWKLQLRNIYPVGTRNIKEEGFEFNIKYEIEGQEPVIDLPVEGGSVRLLEAFGLDQLDASGNPTADNQFDYRPGITILPTTGEIIFPVLEPFDRDLPSRIPNNQFNFSEVYDTTQQSAKNFKTKDKWLLTGKSSGEASSTYQLGFNVVENSVRVLLDGRELTSGVDYVVDYNIGQLTIRNDAALVPGAGLKITYEQNDLFQLASKTLLGARGIIDISKKTKLGFSALNLNQQTLSDKVRIGEEPISNSIYGLDFSTSADLPFLTRVLDNIISTKQISTFSFSGEYAYINPDPNTKKSTITTDQSKSIAYIDDFEGAKRIIPVGISYTGWKDLSPPNLLPFLSDTLSSQELMSYKSKSWWYTITPGNVNVNDIWPNRQAGKQDQQVTVMDYVYRPDTPGTYNTNPLIYDNPAQNWGGIMKLLSSTASNLVEENIEFIEFWARIDNAPGDAKVYIDLGNISEEVIPNGVLNTEDLNQNDAIDEGEDVGLDGLTNASETSLYSKSDPAGDDFFFNASGSDNPLDYFRINGTEGNALLQDIGRLPDTEDLNRNGTPDRLNSYFRFEIPLDTSMVTNPLIVGGGSSGWYQYRIPLKDFTSQFGSPTLSNVEMIRFFVTGVSDMIHLRITEFNLVGSQWQKLDKEDTVISVSVINFEDNLGYSLPPGVFQERDRSRPDENILRNEQSLNLIINNLPDGESREAIKFLFRPLDVFNYSEMKLFVHGDENTMPGSVSYSSNGKYAAEVFFRFGADTNNYYEYRQPVLPGWNEISIPFEQITALKQARDSANVVFSTPVPGRAGHFYQVKGNPTLTSVKFLSVGIHNISEPPPQTVLDFISGEVWINELRVIGADDSPGWAYSFNSSMRFADLMGVSFTMSQTNPYFHRLADRFGSRIESTNWSVQSDLDILKLLPVNLPESNLKVNYSHTEALGKPLYIPGTDIRVDAAGQRLDETNPDSINFGPKNSGELSSGTQNLNISDSWSTSGVKLKIPSTFWLVRDTWNALTFGFNYNKTFSRNPTILSNKAWIWNANIAYGLNLSPDYHINLVDIPVLGTLFGLFSDYRNAKFYFTPQNFALNITTKRNRNTNVTRPRLAGTQVIAAEEKITRDFTATRGFNLNWKVTEGGFINLTTNYNVNINSSLAYLETIPIDSIHVAQRPESHIWNDIFSGAFFGRDYLYSQSTEFRTSPKLPSLWDLNKFFTITAGYSVNYQWNFDFRQEDVGRSAGFGNKTSLGLTLRLKALAEPLFKSEDEIQNKNTGNIQKDNRNKRDLTEELGKDTTQITVKDSLAAEDTVLVDGEKKSAISNALLFLRSVAKVIFFDYESITINFTSDNNLSKSGIAGKGTGFGNFWGFTQNDDFGPTRGFMLGLSRDVGTRAISQTTNLSDVFAHKNNIDLKTSKPLWEGAKIDLTWKVGWSLNKTTTLRAGPDGNIFVSNEVSSGSLNRSFLTLPSFLFFSVFDNGIKKVNELYNPNSADVNASLSSAFIEGFETFPWLSKLGPLKDVAKYIPRPNWRVTWEGLESFFLFKQIAKKVSLDHSYSASYTEGWRLTPDGVQEIQTQRIEYGFAPLVGLNFTFGQLWEGDLTSNVKYSTRTNYDLGISTRNITETFSRDIGITAGYSKSGFELPLFGVSLKNDIEFSFSYTSTQNSIVRYEMVNFTEEGIPQDGTIRTTIEPRIKYTISSKVTLSIFYKRSTVEPEGAARIPPTTTNEAGLDVHISIQ